MALLADADPHRQPDPHHPVLGRRLVVVLALACGVSVANVYFPQALPPLMTAGLHVPAGSAVGVSAIVGEWWGWRAPYVVAAAMALVLTVILARTVPTTIPPVRRGHLSLPAASARLLLTEPDPRRYCGARRAGRRARARPAPVAFVVAAARHPHRPRRSRPRRSRQRRKRTPTVF